MNWTKALIALPLLAACSEQDMCISSATRDLRQVRAFVTEAQGNINRGYAYEEREVIEYDIEQCGETQEGKPIFCRVPEIETVRKPVAIDLDAEAAKLAALQKKEIELTKRASAAVDQCKAQFPE